METYGNGNGNSGIIGYEINGDSISIEWHNGDVSTYYKDEIGELNFLNMKVAAMQGFGLNAFINKNVRGMGHKLYKPDPEPVKDTILTIRTTSTEAVAIAKELLKKFDVDVKLS